MSETQPKSIRWSIPKGREKNAISEDQWLRILNGSDSSRNHY